MKPNKQQGIALIMVIMVVALVSIAVTGMVSRQQLDVRQTANIFGLDRTYTATLAAEDVARIGLRKEGQLTKIDTLTELWAEPVAGWDIGGVSLGGQLEDLQGRFNLNNLVDTDGKPSAEDIKRFERLLSLTGVDPLVKDAVIDWIDADTDVTGLDGAEDDYYMTQTPGYRPPNTAFANASELVLIKGIGYVEYEKLRDFVVALPERTEVNINTASATVLASLVNNFTLQDGESIIGDRESQADGGFATLADFTGSSLIKSTEIVSTDLGVKSGYFLLHSYGELENSNTQLFSVLHRDQNNNVTTVTRGQGVFQ